MSSSIATTPLTSWHRGAGASMSPFAGFEMPIHYGSIVNEHHACRNSVALFDVSHMGRLRFDGENSGELLDHLLTRRITDMQPGDVRYALMCNPNGGVLDDVLVYFIEKPSGGRFHLLVVNASNRDKIKKWLEPHLADFPDVICTDRTELTSMIAVQGPQAMEVSARLLKKSPEDLKYYKCRVTEQFQKPVIVSRTGYTGEDGIELITRADDANRIWENIMLAGREHGISPAGLGARDTLRLEAGMPLYGQELTEDIDPISAGLQFACNIKDRTFIGSDVIAPLKASGTERVRVGMVPKTVRPARTGCKIFTDGDREVGVVTSGTKAPTVGPVAMGYVLREFAAVGTSFQIDIRGQRVDAEIIALPFYRR